MSYSLFYALIPWTQTSSAMHLLNKYLIENFSNKEKYLIFENGVNNTVNSMCSARVNQHTHTYTHGYRWQWRGQAAAKITETSFHNLLCFSTSHTLNLPASTFGPSQTFICLSTFGCECICICVCVGHVDQTYRILHGVPGMFCSNICTGYCLLRKMVRDAIFAHTHTNTCMWV